MTKLYFIFLLCALTSAENAGAQYSNGEASRLGGLGGGYHATHAISNVHDSRTTSPDGANEHSAYISQTGAVRSGTGTPRSYTQHHAYIGSTSDVKDHNGLTQDEVLKLIADGHRRRLHLYNQNRPRLPKRYNSIPPRYYAHIARNDEGDDSNSASIYGSSGSHQISARSIENVGTGYEANREDSSERAQQEQEAENARRFFLLNNKYTKANNPLDPYADLNNKNYREAFGQYKKFLK